MIEKIVFYYNKLPKSICVLFLSFNCFGKYLYGLSYLKYKKKLKKLRSYNNDQDLIKSVSIAIDTVPYYKSRYSGTSKIVDFKKIDFINKDIVMNNYDNFISSSINESEFDDVTTGGTSGNPLCFKVPKNRYVVELATMHTLWETTGWKYNSRAVIRNHKLPKDQDFIVNPITKEVIFDNFRMNDEYMFIVYHTLRKYNIKYIHAYPSAAYLFSVFLHKNKLDVSFITAFFSGSENIFEYQKNFIEKKLGIRFYNWFGHSEKLVLGGYCKGNDVYHIEPSYGYFELIDDDGNAIREVGKVGEIVGTALHNIGMPLIRYKTGDYAEYAGDYCPQCNRHLPLIRNIKGRWNGEKIFKQNDEYITTTSLNLHDDLLATIRGIQFIQKKKGFLDVIIIKGDNYSDIIHERFIKHFEERLGSEMNIEIQFRDKLILKENGKFVQLISNINIKTL